MKAELAGRRGICPECGVKFIVPSFSGGRVAEDDGTGAKAVTPAPVKKAPPSAPPPAGSEDASGTPSVFIPTAPATPKPAAASNPNPNRTPTPTPSAPVAPTAAPPSSAEVAWYVRPAAGGQFGPASTDVFRGWIEDGRVAADSWVWRTGWTDWRAGGEAIGALADVIVPPPTVTPPAPGAPDAASELPHHPASTADARRAELRRRRQRNNAIALALGVVALIVAVVMALVLNR